MDHADARGGGRDHHLGVMEDLHEATNERDGLALVAGVEVHLAAAGLLAPELDGVAQPLQHLNGGTAGLRKQRVVEAGDKQCDAHGAYYYFVA